MAWEQRYAELEAMVADACVSMKARRSGSVIGSDACAANVIKARSSEMVKLRSQEEDLKGKGVDTGDSIEQRLSLLEETTNQRFSKLEEMFAALMTQNQTAQRETEERSTLDRRATSVKEESIPQFLIVTEADSTCVQHTDVILPQVSISPLEHSLNFCKANLAVMGNCQYVMGKTHQIWSDSNFGCVNDDACQVFDVIPMRTQVLPKEHKERFHKSWRFKFKHRVAPRDPKSVSDVQRTTSGPNSMLKMLLDAGGIVVTDDGSAILREIEVAHPAAKLMIELSHTQDEEVGDGTTPVIVLAGELLQDGESFIEKSYHHLVKSCIGTKFISYGYFRRGPPRVDRYGSGAVIVNKPDELQESDVVRCPLAEHLKPEYVVFFTKAASGNLEQFSGLSKELKGIDVSLASFYNWLRQIRFVIQQLMRNKKIKLPKRWWFKYKYHCYVKNHLPTRELHSLQTLRSRSL